MLPDLVRSLCRIREPEGVKLMTEMRAGRSQSVSLATLRRLSHEIASIAAASNLGDVRVFGSVARGEQTAESDVDLIVMPRPGATLFDIARFELDMEQLLGVPVTAISAASVHPQADERMLREAVPL